MNVLTPMFLGLSLFLAAPSFAEDANTSENRVFSEEEIEKVVKKTNLAHCIKVGKLSVGLAAIETSPSQKEFQVQIESMMKGCEVKVDYTRAQHKEFKELLSKKYGSKENQNKVFSNSYEMLIEAVESQQLQPKPQ